MRYHFSGVAGAGMGPLACLMRARGHAVQGSDRAFDLGKKQEIAEPLRRLGIALAPQDGTAVTAAIDRFVYSAAVEADTPELRAARALGIACLPRPQLLAEVKGAFYPVAGLVAHKVVAKETLRVGDRVAVVADSERRARIIRNHTGTHLVNAALRNILGTHVKQSGSLNAPERLRFDFSHFAHVDAEELRDIEQQVNDEIRLNSEVETNVTSLEEALASGALAFFGDKYPEHNVRVVTIPDPRAARGFYSKELCGGTHVQRVGDIGMLKIVSEESVAAGVRRIEAVTGIGALEHFQKQADILRQLASQLNVGKEGILAEVEKLSQTAKQLERELEAQKRKGALSQIDELAGRVQVVKGIKLIAAEVQNVDREGLRQLVDSLRQKLGSGVVALGMPENGKVALIAGVTKDLTAKVHAGKLIQALAKQLGGSGGGRPDLAEAGAKDTAGLKSALLSIPSLLEPLL